MDLHIDTTKIPDWPIHKIDKIAYAKHENQTHCPMCEAGVPKKKSYVIDSAFAEILRNEMEDKNETKV